MKKLSFKIERPTGRFRSFYHASCDIKSDGKVVGSIAYRGARNVNGCYKVGLMVVDETQHSGWKWITLTKQFDAMGDEANIKLAKEWVKIYWDHLNQKYNLHKLVD